MANLQPKQIINIESKDFTPIEKYLLIKAEIPEKVVSRRKFFSIFEFSGTYFFCQENCPMDIDIFSDGNLAYYICFMKTSKR